jgi:hypothetical protein
MTAGGQGYLREFFYDNAIIFSYLYANLPRMVRRSEREFILERLGGEEGGESYFYGMGCGGEAGGGGLRVCGFGGMWADGMGSAICEHSTGGGGGDRRGWVRADAPPSGGF